VFPARGNSHHQALCLFIENLDEDPADSLSLLFGISDASQGSQKISQLSRHDIQLHTLTKQRQSRFKLAFA
jgi:hypothetical protein